ncbi:hypothetical protein [Sphingobium fuliginis]|nr:hypothetical protein [Sphingobium fuliginis]
MFLLARIEREDGLLDRAALEQVYIREYLGDMHQMDRRIQGTEPVGQHSR